MGTTAQQLLDRFLLGYPREGGFHHLTDCKFGILLETASTLIQERKANFGLHQFANLEEALTNSDGVVVTWKGKGIEPKPGRLDQILEKTPANTRIFVDGNLAQTAAEATQLFERAEKSNVLLTSGASMAVSLQLPEIKKPTTGRIKEIVIVTHGKRGEAEMDAIQGLLQFSNFQLATLKQLQGDQVWKAADARNWSGKLAASALSRSNTMQGGALIDGRTQDIFGLGLLPNLAKKPRAIVMEDKSGMRATILVLDGAIEDTTLAFSDATGAILSTQLYRPPAPNREEFSRMAAAVEDFFRLGIPILTMDQSQVVADFMERFRAFGSYWR
ncbi:MAG: hypothetical protein JWM99_4824 [Verrucomicrobiales bacterium]|nr:hypothetical protein [Verrucomicrobiales bacterium]